MHVALYTYSLLPARGYGGGQRVIVWLARALVELGHEVTILALPGSRVPDATVLSFDPGQIRRPGFDIVDLLPDTIDLVHAHGLLTTAPRAPHVFTLHGNLHAGRVAPGNTIFLSADHARRHGTTTFVYNGVDPSEFVFRPNKADYDLFLGRLHSVKGYRWAIAGARRAGRRLILAGGWRPRLRRSHSFAGSVDGKRKADLLAGAECLWMPALWDEPFGLTLVEAMISGTPVLGTRRGALPEIVSAEVGALGNTLEELVELRSTIGQCHPEDCRARAERWFSHLAMAEEYVRMYRHYLSTGSLPPGRLTVNSGTTARP
jgi:glycosyltransferase involved in cell wall biosynthesis